MNNVFRSSLAVLVCSFVLISCGASGVPSESDEATTTSIHTGYANESNEVSAQSNGLPGDQEPEQAAANSPDRESTVQEPESSPTPENSGDESSTTNQKPDEAAGAQEEEVTAPTSNAEENSDSNSQDSSSDNLEPTSLESLKVEPETTAENNQGEPNSSEGETPPDNVNTVAPLYMYPDKQTLIGYDDPIEGQSVPDYKATMATLFNTSLVRSTTNAELGVSNGSARHGYSRRQVWNSDESRMMIGESILDSSSLEVLIAAVPLSSEKNWSNVDSNVIFGMRFVSGVLNVFARHDISTNTTTNYYTFDGYERCLLGDGEGSISNDDTHAAIVCTSLSDGQKYLFSYDVENNQVLGSVQLDPGYNWASATQSGNWIIAEIRSAQSSGKDEIVRYNLDLSESVVLTNNRSHGDLGLDSNGDDVLVMITWDYISYVRIADSVRVNVQVSNPDGDRIGNGHVSCRNIMRPGWCYFSSYKQNVVGSIKLEIEEGAVPYIDNKGLEVLDGVAVMEHWGFHRSTFSVYQSQPQASVSPTGTKLIFASDWYDRGEINSYVNAFPQ